VLDKSFRVAREVSGVVYRVKLSKFLLKVTLLNCKQTDGREVEIEVTYSVTKSLTIEPHSPFTPTIERGCQYVTATPNIES
jgi:hypothetical protein